MKTFSRNRVENRSVSFLLQGNMKNFSRKVDERIN